ncbi:MAG: transporter substrate-binding domain-containing protein [Pirellulales bacterium]
MIVFILLCSATLSSSGTSVCRAEGTWERVRRTGEFVWGGDQEGGGPYIVADEDDPGNLDKLRGFEVELAAMLAEELGKAAEPPRTIKAVFRQGDWMLTPETLGSQIDVALNGYELTPVRQRRYLCSRPYYVYGLQLLAQRLAVEVVGRSQSVDRNICRRRVERNRRAELSAVGSRHRGLEVAA